MNEEKNIISLPIGRNLYLNSLSTKENVTTAILTFDSCFNFNFIKVYIFKFFHIDWSYIINFQSKYIKNKCILTLSFKNEFLTNFNSFEEACRTVLNEECKIRKCDIGKIEYKQCYNSDSKLYWSIDLTKLSKSDFEYSEEDLLVTLVSFLGTMDFCLWYY